jgi:[acyl-carrier-protein] S-malonyltransferase
MGVQAYPNYEGARKIFDIGSNVIGQDLAEICFGSQTDKLSSALVQPAIVAAELANYHMLRKKGLNPELLMGHSLGEIAALGASEALSTEDIFRVTEVRARVTEASSQTNPGGMAAMVGFRSEQTPRILAAANRHLHKLGKSSAGYIANRNWQLEQVLSGHEEAIERVKRIVAMLKSLQIVDRAAVIKLRVPGAFHSPLNEDGVGELKEAFEGVDK